VFPHQKPEDERHGALDNQRPKSEVVRTDDIRWMFGRRSQALGRFNRPDGSLKEPIQAAA
jgi:hypothetical protein